MMLAFGIFGAAMLAEPAVPKIEKVIGLIQMKRTSFGCQSFKTDTRSREGWLLLAPHSPAPRVRTLRKPHRNNHPSTVPEDSDLNGIPNLVLVQ